jgi:hypothetical protein
VNLTVRSPVSSSAVFNLLTVPFSYTVYFSLQLQVCQDGDCARHCRRYGLKRLSLDGLTEFLGFVMCV